MGKDRLVKQRERGYFHVALYEMMKLNRTNGAGGIPYVPRYETPQDEEQNDACNVWYAEVDAEQDRLLLFDMTQGETALLAVVPLAY